jgi:hypothetical protein
MRKLDVMGPKSPEAAAAKVSSQKQLRPGRAARKLVPAAEVLPRIGVIPEMPQGIIRIVSYADACTFGDPG